MRIAECGVRIAGGVEDFRFWIADFRLGGRYVLRRLVTWYFFRSGFGVWTFGTLGFRSRSGTDTRSGPTVGGLSGDPLVGDEVGVLIEEVRAVLLRWRFVDGGVDVGEDFGLGGDG